MAVAVFLTRAHTRFLRHGLADLTDPPAPSPLRKTLDRLNQQIDQLAPRSHLAA